MFTLLSAQPGRSFSEDTGLYDRAVTSTNVVLDLWWLWAILIIAAIAAALWIAKNRLLSRLDAQCRSAFADIDVLLTERHDLIPNLVAVTKEVAEQELEVLDRILEAHQAALETTGGHRMSAEATMGNAVNQLVSAASAMPKLESSAEFRELKKELVWIEEKITAARRYYNMTVGEYDAVRRGILSEMVSRSGGYGEHARFDLAERREEMAQAPRVAFG